MKIYRFRVLVDQSEHVFRDIEISATASFKEFHEIILQSFGFSGMEMASFYMSNDQWDKGEEIALMDFNDEMDDGIRTMDATALDEKMYSAGDKALYLYDFLRMWIFFVELLEIYQSNDGHASPKVVLSVGDAPREFDKAMVQSFPASQGSLGDEDDDFGMYGDDLDEDDLEQFSGYHDDSY